MIFVLFGCQSLTGVSTTELDGVSVDSYSGEVRYLSEMLTDVVVDNQHGEATVQVDKLFLSAERQKGQPPRYFINVVNNYYSNLRLLTYALDSKGDRFRAGWVTHQLNCSWNCGYNEIMQIELSPKYVLAHRLEGIAMKFYGAGNLQSNSIDIAPEHIQSMVDAIPEK